MKRPEARKHASGIAIAMCARCVQQQLLQVRRLTFLNKGIKWIARDRLNILWIGFYSLNQGSAVEFGMELCAIDWFAPDSERLILDLV